jgi:hypothetical protein
VDLPDPDGAEMMKTEVIPDLTTVPGSSQSAALVASARSVIFNPAFAGTAGLGKNGVGFAVHLLQQKIQFLSDLSALRAVSRPTDRSES